MKGTTKFLTKNVEKIIKSEAFKYVFILLTFINILAYVTTNAMLCLVTFIIAFGASERWVSPDNLGINLFVALFISNVIFSCGRVQESFSSCNKRRQDGFANKKKQFNKEGLDNMIKQLSKFKK